MHRMCKPLLVLLVSAFLFACAAAIAGADPVLKCAVLQAGYTSSTKVTIRDANAVAGASFGPSTPRGWIDVNCYQAAAKAVLRGANVGYANAGSAVDNAGMIAINGAAFVVGATDTVQDVIDAINADPNAGVVATFSVNRVLLTCADGYGSDHSFTYAETDDILNGGAGNNGTISGTDATAVVTYADATTEMYSSGKGLRLVGDSNGAVIDMTAAGGTRLGNYADAIYLGSDALIGCGDWMEGWIYLTNDLPTTNIECTDPDVIIENPWSAGYGAVMIDHVRAASTVGNHVLTFLITDSAGVHTLNVPYTTVPAYGAGVSSLFHPIMASAAEDYLFKVSGTVTAEEGYDLWLSDGSGQAVKLPNQGGGDWHTGDHLMVRGQLDLGVSPRVLRAHSTTKVE